MKLTENILIARAMLCMFCGFVMIGSAPASADDVRGLEAIQNQLQALSFQVQQLSKTVEQQNQIIKLQEVKIEGQKQDIADAARGNMNVNLPNGTFVQGHNDPNSNPNPSHVKLTMTPAPKIETLDGQYSFQPIARMHLDAVHVDDDNTGRSGGMDIRRVRLGAKGKLGHDFAYKAEVDFEGDDVELTDFYLHYSGLEALDIAVGHQRPKIGLQQLTSSNTIRFLERSAAVNALLPGRRLGVNVEAGGDHWSLGIGAFGEGAANVDEDDKDRSFEGRGTVNVMGLLDPQTDHVLHLGTGYSTRRPDNNEASFNARPGVGNGVAVVDTGIISQVDTVDVFGLELAGVIGGFSAQAEYFAADIDRKNGASGVDFDGYYAQVGYYLTGERPVYDGASGTFGRIKPHKPFDVKTGGAGAVELVARYDTLDLNDASANIAGGKVNMLTGGINWHLNNNVRLMANIIDVDTNSNAVTGNNDDLTIYSIRTQWSF